MQDIILALLISLMAGLLALISGIMIYISLDEIIPTAHEYRDEKFGKQHVIIIGIITGMVIMAVSLLM